MPWKHWLICVWLHCIRTCHILITTRVTVKYRSCKIQHLLYIQTSELAYFSPFININKHKKDTQYSHTAYHDSTDKNAHSYHNNTNHRVWKVLFTILAENGSKEKSELWTPLYTSWQIDLLLVDMSTVLFQRERLLYILKRLSLQQSLEAVPFKITPLVLKLSLVLHDKRVNAKYCSFASWTHTRSSDKHFKCFWGKKMFTQVFEDLYPPIV